MPFAQSHPTSRWLSQDSWFQAQSLVTDPGALEGESVNRSWGGGAFRGDGVQPWRWAPEGAGVGVQGWGSWRPELKPQVQHDLSVGGRGTRAGPLGATGFYQGTSTGLGYGVWQEGPRTGSPSL